MKGYSIEPSSPVAQMIGLDITGNVVPLQWFKYIKGENGKPNSLAILILADVVYWYRPVEERDEITGELIAYRKKFAADLLQRGYGALAKQYDYTKDQVRDALCLLRNLGLISLDFRTVNNSGQALGNVMFIGLNVKKLKEITFVPLSVKNPIGGLSVNLPIDVGKESDSPIGKESDTYTESTSTENTSETTKLGRESAPANGSGTHGGSIVKNPGALEAIRKFQENNPRGEVDYSDYPEEVRGIIREFCKLWNHRPPARSTRKGGDFALWIGEARELADACGEFGYDALKAAHTEWEDIPLNDRFMVARPGSVVKITRSVAAKLRDKQGKSKEAPESWDSFVLKWHERYGSDDQPTDADYQKFLRVTRR